MPTRTPDHTSVAVEVIPKCDLPHGEETILAYADARMMRGHDAGRWAYVCKDHFDELGCELGLGKGQQLITLSPNRTEGWRKGQKPTAQNEYACQICGEPGGH